MMISQGACSKMRSSVDLFEHVSMQMKVLDFFGLSFRIPYSKSSVYFWLRVLSRLCVGMLVFVIPSIGQIVYLVRLMLSGKAEVQEIASIINLILTEMLAMIKLLDLNLRRNKFELLLDQFTNEEFRFTSPHLQDILAKAVRISQRLFVGFLFSAGMDVLVHVVVVPGLTGFKSLPLKMDFVFFDINEPKYFYYACAGQILYKPCMVSTFVVLQTLPWAAMSFAVSQLDVLIYNFENMKELVKATRNERRCDENEAYRQIFKSCVLHHSAIKRFINSIEDAFRGQLAYSLCLSVAINGTTAMQFFSIESPLKNKIEVLWVFAYLAIIISMLFVDNYFGNSVTVKCAHLSSVIFATPWINLDIKMKKIVIMFIARTQQPVVVVAGRLIHVSLETFTKVMNWTYKGFAVMNQMK